jgi:hypothetical protein
LDRIDKPPAKNDIPNLFQFTMPKRNMTADDSDDQIKMEDQPDPKRNMIADEHGRIQIESRTQQEPPRKRFKGVDDYDSQPEDALFGTPPNEKRTLDLQYYDVTLPEHRAIVIVVENVLFRVRSLLIFLSSD